MNSGTRRNWLTAATAAPKQTLYRVRFVQNEVWDGYAENPKDTVDIEIYEHWLEPVA